MCPVIIHACSAVSDVVVVIWVLPRFYVFPAVTFYVFFFFHGPSKKISTGFCCNSDAVFVDMHSWAVRPVSSGSSLHLEKMMVCLKLDWLVACTVTRDATWHRLLMLMPLPFRWQLHVRPKLLSDGLQQIFPRKCFILNKIMSAVFTLAHFICVVKYCMQ